MLPASLGHLERNNANRLRNLLIKSQAKTQRDVTIESGALAIPFSPPGGLTQTGKNRSPLRSFLNASDLARTAFPVMIL
jgi:hypothetical protein